ncbi:MAG: RDD family protein [Defluviitaleaceae bacterium]|nr:RDD family protein [Defluviitaleaceae bacterium]MCL2275218.1 RDD family protein [Defluviitaleaceae bacterium]
MKIIRRLLANIVDIFVFIAIIVVCFQVIIPLFIPAGEGLSLPWAGVVMVGVCGATFLAQYPFMLVNQTIGKALFGLRVISTNDARPMAAGIIFQRELFAKVMTCYFMCLPVLFGQEGKHDEVCETEVV